MNMRTNCIITYQKSNGDILIRPYEHTIKKIGDETSMGWKILDIHYKHKDNYYCYDDFMRLFEKDFYNELKNKRRKKLLRYAIRQLNKLS